MKLARRLALRVAMLHVPAALASQSIPRDEFRTWARSHAHAVQLVGSGVSAPDLAPLRGIAGNARILALAEPMHYGHEVLVMRNRMIQYAVTALGVRAVALETGLAPSKRVYDHVLGRTTESDSVLSSSFSYGFGAYPENRELIQWLRSYNASRDSSRVRLYGIDVTGQLFGSAAPALFQVFAYLDAIDPDRARALRADLNVTGDLSARRYVQLERREQDAIMARIQDLIALLRRQRPSYVAASTLDEYDWALQSAVNTAQDVAGFRVVTQGLFEELEKRRPADVKPSPQLRAMQEMRDLAMVDNLSWIVEREATRGPVFVYAHMGHLQKHAQVSGPLDGAAPLGVYAQSKFGADYVVIGTYFGTSEGFQGFPEGLRPAPPDSNGIDGLLGSIGVPAYIADLRRLPPGSRLFSWFAQAHKTRSGNVGEFIGLIRPSRAFDAVIYIDRVTPIAVSRRE